MGFIDKIIGSVTDSLGSSKAEVEVGGTPTCANCGRAIDVDAARSAYDSNYNGELSYDDMYADHPLCAPCAIEHSDEALAAGLHMDFNLQTGLPPEDMPDDWTMSKND